MMLTARRRGETIMQAYASTTARTRTDARATPWQVPALIIATLLLGLVASANVDPSHANPALVDGTSVFLCP
jgi:hypothetical protein